MNRCIKTSRLFT